MYETGRADWWRREKARCREHGAALRAFMPPDASNLKDPAPRRLRERARSDGVRPLARRIRRYRPAVITVVMKAIDGDVAAAAEKAGSAGVQTPALPFPNWPAATEDYKSQLASLVARWVDAGVVAAPRG